MTASLYLWLFAAPALLWCMLLLLASRSRLAARCLSALDPRETTVAGSLLWLISSVLVVRVVIGALALLSQSDLSLVGTFFPVRIASPNYGFAAGLPWFALVLIVAARWPRIQQWLADARHPRLALWLFATLLLVASAGIQGGLVAGVSGVYTRPEFIDDVQYVTWTRDFFVEHLQRIRGELVPGYTASHSATHPPLALQLLSAVQQLGPFVMGLLTLAAFAAVFPLLAAVATARGAADKGVQAASLLLVTPALVIYGGSDDAFYYLLWGLALALGYFAIALQRAWLAAWCGAVIALACHLTYASLVLLPAVMAFAGNQPMSELLGYVRQRLAVLSAMAAATVLSLAVVQLVTGFSLLAAMQQVMQDQQPYLFTTWLVVDPIRGIADRLMTVFDFVILAGPVMLATWVIAWRSSARNPLQWSIPAVAFVVLVCWIAVTTPGAGESARGWGGLYLCWWFGCGVQLTQQWPAASVQRLTQFCLCYVAMLQLIIDFGW